MDRGNFFHEVYRIEEKLGRTFRELEPHALFPLDEYFSSTGRHKVVPIDAFPEEKALSPARRERSSSFL